MTQLYFSDATPWDNGRVNDVRIPGNVESWSDAELAAIGLFRPQQPVSIPEGKQVSTTVELVDGVVRFALEDIPPPERRRVLKWTIAERIEAAGLSDAAYEMLTAPGYRGLFIKWNLPEASVYHDDPDTVAMILALGLIPEVVMAP